MDPASDPSPEEEQAFEELDHLFDDAHLPGAAVSRIGTPGPPPQPPPPPARTPDEVSNAIFAESAAMAMDEISERLDSIERVVAQRVAELHRRVDERLQRMERAAAERVQALQRGVDQRLDSTEVVGRLDALDRRVEGLVDALDQLRRAMQALGEYVRRMRKASRSGQRPGPPSGEPTSAGRPSEVVERVWQEPDAGSSSPR